MSKRGSLESLLEKAENREKEYAWLEAAELHEQVVGVIGKREFLRRGEVQEKVGYAFYRVAMQAEGVNQFRDRMRRAVANYEKATGFYGKLSEPEKTPRMQRCEAMIAYTGYWLTPDVSEKKRLLDECWKLTKEALKTFEDAGDALEYGKTYNKLSSAACHGLWLKWDFQAGEKIVREAVGFGEKAITLLSSVGDTYELARAYVKTGVCLTILGYYFIPSIDEKEGHSQKGRDYWQKAMSLSEEAALLELVSIPGESLGWSVDEEVVQYEKALGCAEKTKDKYLIGIALDYLAYANHWKAMRIEDPDKSVEILQRALQCAEDAKHQFSSISYVSPRGGVLWVGAPQVEHYWTLSYLETDLKKRRDLLEKAVVGGTHAVELAENTGYTNIIRYAHHVLSKALGSLGQIEANSEEKKRLLEKALEHRKESVKISQQISPFSYWNQGVMWNYLADLKTELSDVEKDSENKKNMLEEAVSDKERCLQLCNKEVSYWEKMGELAYSVALGGYQYSYGELLNRLYGLTNNNKHQRKAIKAFGEAAESFQRLEMVSRAAECCWKAARGYDALGQHLRAVENFKLASNNYISAAEKLPQLKDFYQEHADYMQAWSEIEKARHHHIRQEYGVAMELFEKAANIHKSLKKWNYLAPNYAAWAKVEQAEELSRKEQTEEAKDLFQQAAKLFVEAKESVKAKLEKIEEKEEREMVADLDKASELRREYCLGRIALEDAKILDRQGNHAVSSTRYAFAAEKFQGAIDIMENEADRQELRPIVDLCRAWHTMTRAESEASPDLYLKASKLFEEAKDHSFDEKAKMLALGHSSFCKALEIGTRFEAVRDTSLHSLATQHLEGAASFYLRAGFRNASEYAEATQKLLDGYLYMHNAKTETDPAKKARFYMMAEKVLQASAGSYLKARHPEKQEQVSRLLEKVREERELAVSLTEVLHAPLATSTTATFTTPTPTKETPIGLERFENADVQANLLLRVREVRIGEDIDLRIELVNAGKAPALLIKVDAIVPEGFEIKEVPEVYTVENNYLNLKGRRLNPLKTEDVKIVVKPRSKGTHVIKPRILYIDENGKYRSHEPEPVTITVKELGIKGWIKGER